MADERQPIMLTPIQTKQLKAATTDFDWLETELDRAEKAGIDVAERRAELVRLRLQQEGMLEVYGTDDSEV